MNYLGIDISKETFDVTLYKGEEKEGEHSQFNNTESGFQKLSKWLKKRKVETQEVHAVMEATNIYWEDLADYLHTQGLKVSVVNPMRTSGFARSEMQRNKTDKIDSRDIAEFARQKKPDAWQPPTAENRKLRALVRHKKSLIKTRTQQKNRLASCKDEDVSASLEKLIAVITDQIAEIEAKIKALISQDQTLKTNYSLITSIPGLGADTAIVLLAEFYDLGQYSSAKSVAADAGITPSRYESGTSVKRRPKISRMGKASVRAALFWPAQTAKEWNPLVKALADRLTARGKSYGVILVASMRKLLHLAFGVVKNQTPFDPHWAS